MERIGVLFVLLYHHLFTFQSYRAVVESRKYLTVFAEVENQEANAPRQHRSYAPPGALTEKNSNRKNT